MPSPAPPPYPCTDDRRRERTHRRRRRARRAVSASRRVRFDSARLTTARGGFFRQWDLQKSESHLTRSKARRKARRPSAVHTPSPASWLRLDVDVDVDRRAREADRPSVARRAARASARAHLPGRNGARTRPCTATKKSTSRRARGYSACEPRRTPPSLSASTAVERAIRYATVSPRKAPRNLAVAPIRVGGTRAMRTKSSPARVGRRGSSFKPRPQK